jgi:hypothetical protein
MRMVTIVQTHTVFLMGSSITIPSQSITAFPCSSLMANTTRKFLHEVFHSISSRRTTLMSTSHSSKPAPTTLVQLLPPPSTLPTNTHSTIYFAHTNTISGAPSCTSRSGYNWDCGNWVWKDIGVWTPNPESHSRFPITCNERQAFTKSSHSCTNSRARTSSQRTPSSLYTS